MFFRRKVIFLIAVICTVTPASRLVASVVNTKHNMAWWSPYTVKATSESRVCKFCHTPHNASPNTPLWGHDLTASGTTFKQYSSSTLVIDDPAVRGTSTYTQGITGATALCLGCHDGLTAIGAVVGADIGMESGYETLAGRPTGYGSGSNVDISNKHPVSFVYNDQGAPSVLDSVNAKSTGANKYGLPNDTLNNTIANDAVANAWMRQGQRVECTICHDPHTNRASDNRDILPFWVSSSVYSPTFGTISSHDSVCISCHDLYFGEYSGFGEYSSL